MKKIKSKKLKTYLRAIIIALFLVIIIRNFLFESYIVIENTMENSIMQGDFVLVNKIKYNPRFPITILTFPFIESAYLNFIQLPYFRIFGISEPQINDVLAFNYPQEFDLPIDKRKVMFSRCVALPGSKINIVNKNINTNNINIDKNNKNLKFLYRFVTDGTKLDSLKLSDLNIFVINKVSNKGVFDLFASDSVAEIISKLKNVKAYRRLKDFPNENTTYVFPQNDFISWNKDYFGELTIPKIGDTLKLNIKNIDIYKDIIENFENNKLEIINSKFKINNIETSNYIVKQNYYFVVDDNRDNAKDSRYWGFLPESHIIGKVNFVWFSYDKLNSRFRWNRVFKSIN